MKKTYVFIRDDDIYKLDKQFLDFHNKIIEEKIPLVYAVIPGKIEKNLVNFLNNEIKKHPYLVNVAQHGFSHKKHEFGEGIPRKKQKKYAQNGLRLMSKNFGKNFVKVFVPPYHKFDKNTLKTLKELKFEAFSANQTQTELLNFPAHISVDNYGKKRKVSQIPLKQMLSGYIHWKKKANLIGIYLHHETLTKKSKEDFFKFIKILKKDKKIKFIEFSSLLNLRKPEMKLKDITFEIINRCNLKCKMCSIWKEKQKTSLSLGNIKEVLLSKNFKKGFVSITGGEPFLHKQISSIFKFLVLFAIKRKITGISIVTNGYDTQKIINFLKKNSNYLKYLHLTFSLDGLEKNHNFQRGKPDAFQSTIKTISLTKEKFPKTNISIKFTINKYNYGDLPDIYGFCKKNNIKLYIKLIEAGTANYYNRIKNESGIFGLNERQKSEIRLIILKILKEDMKNKTNVLEQIYAQPILAYLEGKTFVNKCFTPKYSLFIMSNGNMHPCVYYKHIANIKEKNWKNKIMNKEHQRIIKQAIDAKCPKCMAYHGFLKSWNL